MVEIGIWVGKCPYPDPHFVITATEGGNRGPGQEHPSEHSLLKLPPLYQAVLHLSGDPKHRRDTHRNLVNP